ncbi:hypothetical protein [Nostoc sp. CALU 1950]|uniref:hypothetical protein n=1 Tax=Nostoc sp. CALU 1950 TaxID=3104321 RepID=UPI003EC067D8
MQTTPVGWMTADLQLFCGDSHSKTLREHRNRYEIIDRELFVTLNTKFRKSTKRAMIQKRHSRVKQQ